jgi:hypothetical protein
MEQILSTIFTDPVSLLTVLFILTIFWKFVDSYFSIAVQHARDENHAKYRVKLYALALAGFVLSIYLVLVLKHEFTIQEPISRVTLVRIVLSLSGLFLMLQILMIWLLIHNIFKSLGESMGAILDKFSKR